MLYVLDAHIYALHNTYIYVLGLLDRMRTDHVVVVTIRALLLNKYFNSEHSLFFYLQQQLM